MRHRLRYAGYDTREHRFSPHQFGIPQVRDRIYIVGSRDGVVIELNRQAFDQLRVEKEMVLVRGATHLFEEPGALEEVSRLATEWFSRWMQPLSAGAPAY